MGKERLVELLRQKDDIVPPVVHAYLVAVGENSAESALKLAYDLRAGIPGLRLISNLNGGSFKAQFKRADRTVVHCWPWCWVKMRYVTARLRSSSYVVVMSS